MEYLWYCDPKFYIATGSLLGTIIMGLWLAVHNHKELVRTRPQRVAARREFKKRKNARLMAFYGIEKRKDPNQD